MKIEGLITQRDAATKSNERYKESLTQPSGLYGLNTGHHDFNIATGGHVASKITTLAMRSGHGKTATVIQMGKAAGEVVNNRRAEMLVFSWEMGADYILDRFVCWDLGITLSQLRYPKILPPEIRAEIPKAYARASKYPIYYHQTSASVETTIQIMDKFQENVHKKSVIEGVKIQPVMVLDFIGRIKGSSQYKGSKTYDIEYFLSALKQYNNSSGWCSFILAQLLRSVDSKDFPDMEDIKDSSAIEENSDNLIIGYRADYSGKDTIMNPRDGSKVPSENRMLFRFMKTRENKPHDKIAYCDMRYFRIWSDEWPSWDYDFTKDYARESYWQRQYNG